MATTQRTPSHHAYLGRKNIHRRYHAGRRLKKAQNTTLDNSSTVSFARKCPIIVQVGRTTFKVIRHYDVPKIADSLILEILRWLLLSPALYSVLFVSLNRRLSLRLDSN